MNGTRAAVASSTMSRTGIFALVLASTLFASNAFADDAETPPPAATDNRAASSPRPSAETSWYGYQTLFVDASALGVGMLAPKGGMGFAYAGVATYAIGAPIVHAVHGNGKMALADVALRIGAPIGAGFVGGIVGAATAEGGGLAGLGHMMVGVMYGALAGVGLAVALDSIVLAREDVRGARSPRPSDDKSADAPRPAPQHARLVPTLAPSPTGFTGGVAGTF